MGIQPPSAVAARGDALQQSAPLSNRAASRCMRPRPRVAGDADEVVLIGRPVDIAWMVFGDQHRPLRARHSTHAFAHHAVVVDDALLPRRLRLQGDSSMNTGMECGENVKARATTRFHWCTLPVTRDAAEAALLPSRSRKPGTGTGHRLAFQTGQGTKGKVCWLRRAATVQAPSPDSRRPSLGAASRYSPDAAVSRRALSRVNAVVPARRLTRAAAEARMRRGRWSRGRATS